jgi:exopolyphosphatase/guanosine-5'-triphosphate,3'-diphosphate pyrophosphatase
MSRYGVDREQVTRVKQIALKACDKVADGMFLRPIHRELLGWSCDLHEIGLGISHSHYHVHSGYLVEHSDMTGFTRQEQLFLAALVRNHRRSIPREFTDQLPTRLHEPLRKTLFCLRFACILSRSRESRAIPPFRLSGGDNQITVSFPADWSESHPLTLFDLQQESGDLQAIGLQFQISKPSNAE